MQDDRIRTLLADVEVKPSRRVWSNIESKLDAVEAPSASVSASWNWARWLGASVALAALALGIFLFTGKSDQDQPIPTYINITEAPTAQASPVLDEPELGVLIPENNLLAEQAPARKQVSKTLAEAVREEIAVEETSEPIAEEEQQPAAAPEAEKPVQKSLKKTFKKSFQTDAFAQMESEDLQRFKPIRALYAQGAIGGNDSDIRFSGNSARMSSGTPAPKTGITEIGESVFGIPFSVGLGVRFYLAPQFSLGAGVSYSLLSRTFDGEYRRVSSSGAIEFSEIGNVHHQMHYVGIPVNAYYDIISGENIKFYVFAGGEAEFCVSNKYTLYSATDIVYRSPVNSIQWSAGAGLGVEFKLSPLVGLYVEPSARYYFHNNQPKNVRTERPFMANLDAGLRFDF